MVTLGATVAVFVRPDWYDQALCLGAGPRLFYAERGEGSGIARQVCAECEVRQACLEFALERNECHGMWGGLSERERRGMVIRRRRPLRPNQETHP